MVITKLRGGNSQFPGTKEVGDVVVLALGDIFCWDGGMWQLVGGRFLPQAMREEFLHYVKTGWPDASSARFDLPAMLDLSVFVNYGPTDLVPADPKWVEKFIARVAEVSERIAKNQSA